MIPVSELIIPCVDYDQWWWWRCHPSAKPAVCTYVVTCLSRKQIAQIRHFAARSALTRQELTFWTLPRAGQLDQLQESRTCSAETVLIVLSRSQHLIHQAARTRTERDLSLPLPFRSKKGRSKFRAHNFNYPHFMRSDRLHFTASAYHSCWKFW